MPFFVSIVLLSFFDISGELLKATYWAKFKAAKQRRCLYCVQFLELLEIKYIMFQQLSCTSVIYFAEKNDRCKCVVTKLRQLTKNYISMWLQTTDERCWFEIAKLSKCTHQLTNCMNCYQNIVTGIQNTLNNQKLRKLGNINYFFQWIYFHLVIF